jgi:hypothetical protein
MDPRNCVSLIAVLGAILGGQIKDGALVGTDGTIHWGNMFNIDMTTLELVTTVKSICVAADSPKKLAKERKSPSETVATGQSRCLSLLVTTSAIGSLAGAVAIIKDRTVKEIVMKVVSGGRDE